MRNNDGDKCSVQYNDGLLPDIMYGYAYSKSMDQPCKVAHPARGCQLNEGELLERRRPNDPIDGLVEAIFERELLERRRHTTPSTGPRRSSS